MNATVMHLRIQAFHLPKAGNSPEEYEDAFEFDNVAKLVAVADGASDSFESRRWAQALVQTFVRKPPIPDASAILEWLSEPISMWKAGIDWKKLPWYSAEKARRGAFSTLLGLTFEPKLDCSPSCHEESHRWRAIAIGDACLFQIRERNLSVSFPIERASEFGTTPALLSTQLEYTQHSLNELRLLEGNCSRDDLLVIATDSFSAWFLSRTENGEQPWLKFRYLSPQEFVELVDRARREDHMRNDDVTLLIVTMDGDSGPPPLSEDIQPAGVS